MKVVINACYGGFGLSQEALELYHKLKGTPVPEFGSGRDIERNDPDLIKVVEQLKKKADGGFSKLEIVEIPDDVKWQIEDYDGVEHVAEQHRTWS